MTNSTKGFDGGDAQSTLSKKNNASPTSSTEYEANVEVPRVRADLDGARRMLQAYEHKRTDQAAAVGLTREAERGGRIVLDDLIRAKLPFGSYLAKTVTRMAVERLCSNIKVPRSA